MLLAFLYVNQSPSSFRQAGLRLCSTWASVKCFIRVRQVALLVILIPHTYINDLELDFDLNLPVVNRSRYAKFGLDQPGGSTGHKEHTDIHTAITPFII